MRYFILDENREPKPVKSVLLAAAFFEFGPRSVAKTEIGDAGVSTVFLVFDHGNDEDDEPVLWETMIFGGPHDLYQFRCAGGWQDALDMHAKVVAHLLAGDLDAEIEKGTIDEKTRRDTKPEQLLEQGREG